MFSFLFILHLVISCKSWRRASDLLNQCAWPKEGKAFVMGGVLPRDGGRMGGGGVGTDHWLEGLTVKMRWGQRRQVGWVTLERTQSTWDLFTRLNLRFPRCQGQVKLESSKFLSHKFSSLNLLESWKRRRSGYKPWLLKKAEFGVVSN